MPQLVILTGPIGAGKNTVADKVAERLTRQGRTVVVADVDDVAAMVAVPGAAQAGLWFAAHQAHGALIGQWMRSSVDYVVAVGPVYTVEEQTALTSALPEQAAVLWATIDVDGMKERGLAPRDSRRDVRGAHVKRRRRPHMSAE